MMPGAEVGLVIGMCLFFWGAITKEQDKQLALCFAGLGLSLFSLWGVAAVAAAPPEMLPALTLLFGVSSFYTKGNTQMMCILMVFIMIWPVMLYV